MDLTCAECGHGRHQHPDDGRCALCPCVGFAFDYGEGRTRRSEELAANRAFAMLVMLCFALALGVIVALLLLT